jgi:protein phosphatase
MMRRFKETVDAGRASWVEFTEARINLLMQVRFFGFSDKGKTRKNNEDSYLCNEEEGLFLVADGLGGHASGGEVSQLAITCIEEFVIRSRSSDDIPWPIKYRKNLSSEQIRLMAATSYTHHRIHEVAEANPSMKGMCTTLVGVIIEGDHLAIVNVGDSRLYRIRGEVIQQVTRDHSWVEEQVREGNLTREEARRHPQRHVLTSVLGGRQREVNMDVSLAGILKNDLYLLCSDGLYSMLEDSKILAVTNSVEDRSLYKLGFSLILEANLVGGLDNITVVLLSF